MKLMLRFSSELKLAELDEEALLETLIEAAASLFHISRSNVLVGPTPTKLFGAPDAGLTIRDAGIFHGDVVFVKSLAVSDDLKTFRLSETLGLLSKSSEKFEQYSGQVEIKLALLPLDVCARKKGLTGGIITKSTSELAQVEYSYGGEVRASIVFKVYLCGVCMCYAAGVANRDIRNYFAVKVEDYFVSPHQVDTEARENYSVLFKHPQDLIARLSDELVEQILVDIHDKFRLPYRVGLLTLPESVLTRILSPLAVVDLVRVSSTCRKLNAFIRQCEAIWRRKLADASVVFGPAATDVCHEGSTEAATEAPSLQTLKILYRRKKSKAGLPRLRPISLLRLLDVRYPLDVQDLFA